MTAEFFRLRGHTSYLEITLGDEESLSYADGDVDLGIDISSNGFSGGNGVWIVGHDFTLFCKQLHQLDASLKGEAILQSASPDELNLRIFSVNSRGGMAVEVSIGRWFETRDDMFWHSIKAGFGFEPKQLAKVLTLPWIAKRLYCPFGPYSNLSARSATIVLSSLIEEQQL